MQLLLDAHPDVCCRGEGLFQKTLAEPIDALMAKAREEIAEKNATLFRGREGYPPPGAEEADALFATAVLLALERQRGGRECHAIGEKTPENVFLFGRLRRVFPRAKFIGIARDPRDVLTSAWHFFHSRRGPNGEERIREAFLETAFPSLNEGARVMLALAQNYPDDCLVVTYERLSEQTATVAAALFRFLGVADDPDVVADCVARTSFPALAGGRRAGDAENGAFFRKGVIGDWRSTLTPPMNALILRELGWMYPRFGWEP